MAQLNVNISDEAYQAAKGAAEERGMMLRKWVERTILEVTAAKAGATERKLVPIEEA